MRSQVPSPIVPPILVRKPSLVRERGIKSKDTLPDRERLLSDRAATPRRMLQGDALASAPGAPGRLAQPVAGGLRSPPDDQRYYRNRAPCRQAELVQWAHHQQLVRCNSCKVETGPSLRMCT